MKRGCSSSSSDRLTGGTDDVNPQQLIMIGADDYLGGQTGTLTYRHQFNNPAWDLNRSMPPGGCNKKAYVMEVLGVDLLADFMSYEATMGVSPQLENYISLVSSQNPIPALQTGSGYTATLEWITQSVRDQASLSTNLLAVQQNSVQAATTPTGSPFNTPELWHHFDLTDGNGHGVIVGNQLFTVLRAIRLTASSGFLAGGSTYYGVKVLYRYKGISYDDFVRQFTFGM